MGNIKLHIVTDIKRCSWFPRKSLAMLSLQILRICPRSSSWTNQWDKLFVAPFTTSSMILGKSKFHLPMRDYMLESERIRNEIDAKKRRMRIIESEKQDIFFENRNPRHMELSGFNKPTGFTTLYERRNFYNKLHLEITNRHTKAFVENINGQIICYASTTELGIAKRLHSATDVCAVVNIARVLAERLKKVGITRVSWNVRYPRTTEKVVEFEGVLVQNGIVLSEPKIKVLKGAAPKLPPKPEKRTTASMKMNKSLKRMGTSKRRLKKVKTRY